LPLVVAQQHTRIYGCCFGCQVCGLRQQQSDLTGSRVSSGQVSRIAVRVSQYVLVNQQNSSGFCFADVSSLFKVPRVDDLSMHTRLGLGNSSSRPPHHGSQLLWSSCHHTCLNCLNASRQCHAPQSCGVNCQIVFWPMLIGCHCWWWCGRFLPGP
jgi:hypothetical protein